MRIREYLPGWGLMLLVGIASGVLSGLIEIGGRHPVEAVVIAILMGTGIRNLGLVPHVCIPGILAFEKVLILGIVLIGASLDIATIGSQGWGILAIVIVAMGVGFFLILGLARLFRLPSRLALLLSVGTTICGGTAIAVTAPLIEAREEETSYAIGTIALWGLIAILAYPALARLLGVSDFHFGVFAGTAIHSTPQVVGAGFIYSELAGRTATAVKLVRNCFMVPVAFWVAVRYGRLAGASRSAGAWRSVAKAFPWFLFGYFIMAGLNTAGALSPAWVERLSVSGKFLILLGLAGIGLNTTLSSFRTLGFKPVVVGLLGSVAVAALSIGMIALIL